MVLELIKQLQNDITMIWQYLDVHSTGKLTPVLVHLHHLIKELIKINKQLPTSLLLPGSEVGSCLLIVKTNY